jgi:hypothetical protein
MKSCVIKSYAGVLLSFFCAICLVACEHESATTEAAVSQSAPLANVAETPSAGGYEPSADERVPGITMSQEELDKIYAEARRNMPLPVIPQE